MREGVGKIKKGDWGGAERDVLHNNPVFSIYAGVSIQKN